MNKLNNAQRAAIFKALADAHAPMRYGEVSSYDPQTFSAKVTIQPEGIQTGWLPILSIGTGGGFGIFCGLMPPAQVAVMHFEGDRDNGLVIGITPNETDEPPAVPGGEIWVVHKDGAFVKLTNDKKVAVNSTVEIDLGNVGNSMQPLCTKAFHDWAENHVHPGGAPPTTTPPDDSLTAITKAN